MDGWTPDEAALLLAGSNPLRISGFDADPNIYKPDFTSCGYLGLKMRLQRAHEAGVLAFPCHPLKVIEWANSKHAIPAPLEPWLIAPTATPDPVPATQAAPLVNYEPVKVESVEQRRARYLALLEAEERHGKYGALKRIAEREGVDRSNMSKDIDKARGARTTQSRAGNGWATQLVRDGKHTG